MIQDQCRGGQVGCRGLALFCAVRRIRRFILVPTLFAGNAGLGDASDGIAAEKVTAVTGPRIEPRMTHKARNTETLNHAR
jgi:hypothetical protein